MHDNQLANIISQKYCVTNIFFYSFIRVNVVLLEGKKADLSQNVEMLLLFCPKITHFTVKFNIAFAFVRESVYRA